MIPDNIKSVFRFIDFLEANIYFFQTFVPKVNECLAISYEMEKVDPNNSFLEREKYNDLNERKNRKYNELKTNVIDVINQKAFDLKIWTTKRGVKELNLNRSSIAELKRIASHDDIELITNAIQSYLKFRTETKSYFLSFERVFWDLDRLLKECDTYFAGKASAKWVDIEPKASSNKISGNLTGPEIEKIITALAAFNFFQIELIADLEHEGVVYKNIKQRNNDSILTPENWETHKETFLTQRMATYKKSYTSQEKLKLELEALEKLPVKETDHQILKGRYKDFLFSVATPNEATIVEMMHKDFEDLVNELRKDWT